MARTGIGARPKPLKQGQRQKQGIPNDFHVNKAGQLVANKGRRNTTHNTGGRYK